MIKKTAQQTLRSLENTVSSKLQVDFWHVDWPQVAKKGHLAATHQLEWNLLELMTVTQKR
jgi:hypothetical protein